MPPQKDEMTELDVGEKGSLSVACYGIHYIPLDSVKAITPEERDILSVESLLFGQICMCAFRGLRTGQFCIVTSIFSLSLFPRTLSQPTPSQQQPIT